MSVTVVPIRIIGLKADLLSVTERLYDLSCLDIEDIQSLEDVSVRPLRPDEDTRNEEEYIRSTLGQVESLIQSLELEVDKAIPCQEAAESALDIHEGVTALRRQVGALLDERSELQGQLETLPRYEETLRKLVPFLPDSAREPGNTVVGLFIPRHHRRFVQDLRAQVLEITRGDAEFATGNVDEDNLAVLLVFNRKFGEAIDRFLGREDVTRLRLPEELGHGPPDMVLTSISLQLAQLPDQLAAVDDQLDAMAEDWRDRLLAWQRKLRRDLERFAVLDKFGETESAFVVVGWTPASELPGLERGLEQAAEGRIVIEELLAEGLDRRAPVIMDNPALARPFEDLVELLEIPRYGHLDPTPLMAIFLPLFFGMMLGDAGYGALLLILSLAMQRIFREGTINHLLKVFVMGAGWSIVFGFLYGEIFGTLGASLGLRALWFDRGHGDQIPTLLALTIGVGAAHTLLGLILGVWEAAKDRSRYHLLERGGMLLGLVGLFILVAVLVEYLPDSLMTPSVAILILGVVLLGASEGWIGLIVGPIEFLGVIGNVLSYLRIAAIGLASVFLATVANQIAGVLGSLIVGIIVAVLIHALNLVMGTFSPAIHSLRLHYVEFFRKFYEGGGRKYQPFGVRTQGSWSRLPRPGGAARTTPPSST